MNIKPIEFPVKGRCKDITRSSYPRRCGIQGHSRDPLVDKGDELVGDGFTVTFPVLAILDSAALEVTTAPVNEDCDEERGIKVWDR